MNDIKKNQSINLASIQNIKITGSNIFFIKGYRHTYMVDIAKNIVEISYPDPYYGN
jgi:hypothetical protein